ncbi:MAG: hypothetical protein A2854_00175 [Parcubacteria group bacterium RIFCSPHIGHO2_01_FULL_56_18]|nr:MAG: hypothetical protein A2854_00175 [Parcubacteria group bacterium RIFCSPHIGHO2_01_FULL_56_18]
MNYGAAVGTIAALVLSVFAAATPALACGGGCGGHGGDVDVDNEVKISVSNFAVVTNITTAEASTGGNYAGGSTGGEGGNAGNGDEGGNADADADSGDGDADADAEGGNGGNGGSGGNGGAGGVGGTISTGDAEANAGVANVVNSTDIEVEGCGCDAGVNYDEDEVDDITVDNEVEIDLYNGAFLLNVTDAYAKTGWNAADGTSGGSAGSGGEGEEGGKADADADTHGHGDANADAEGGEGGNGGYGGEGGFGGAGGLVVTGDATSNAGAVNVVNSTLLRVRR